MNWSLAEVRFKERTLEIRLKKRVLRDLKKLPQCWVLKTHERARRGTPDLLICLKGRFVAIELKRSGEFPTPLQEEILKRAQRAEGVAFFTTPEQWPTHLQLLKDLASA